MGAVLLLLITIIPFRQLGNEFMPPLNEGSILFMPTALPGMSISEATQTMQTMDRIIADIPEVEHVFGKVGRSTSATDPAPLSMVETVITLKPEDQWREGMTWDGLIQEMDSKLKFPGMPNIFGCPYRLAPKCSRPVFVQRWASRCLVRTWPLSKNGHRH